MRLYCSACDLIRQDYETYKEQCPECDAPMKVFVEPEVSFACNRVDFTPSITVEPIYSQEGWLRKRQAG